MPRPKRTKVAPSGPRIQKVTKPVQATKLTPAPRSFDDLYDVSDQEKATRNTRSAQKAKSGKENAVVATRTSGISRDIEDAESRELVDAAQRRSASLELDLNDEAMRISSSPHIETGRRGRGRGRRTPAMDNSVLAIGNFRRRAREPSILGGRIARDRSSSIDSDLAEGSGLTSVGRINNSVLGMEASSRRARQASATRGRPGSVRPSSPAFGMDRPTPGPAQSVLRVGTFKRRAREPSILGTARKPQLPRPEFDSDSDDFMPEDESTPLNLGKSRVVPSSSGSMSNSRKRKLSNVQVPRSQETPVAHTSRSILNVDDSELEDDAIPATLQSNEEEEDQQEADEARPEEEEELSPDDAPLPSIERPVTPEPMSETMAPPRSSSSSLSLPPSPPLPSTTRIHQPTARTRRIIKPRTPPRLDHNESSPISSPPSLTHSPDIPTRSKSRKPTQPPPPQPANLSTAALQALLPRRRQRHRSTFDIESDNEVDVTGLGEDDDELHIPARPTTRRQRLVNAPSSKRTQNTKAATTTITKGKGKTRRTYGKSKPTTSDKENENDNEDEDDSLAPQGEEGEGPRSENSQELEKRVGKELKKATRKFQEVDKWELEFEEFEGSSDRGGR